MEEIICSRCGENLLNNGFIDLKCSCVKPSVKNEKWVVCNDYTFYPDVIEYNTEERAIKEFRKQIAKSKGENIYLCKVLEKFGSKGD